MKTKAQVSVNKTMSYRSEIQSIYRRDGLKGLTRGYTGMLMRDSPGFGLYFCTFEFLKRSLNLQEKERQYQVAQGCTKLDKYCIGANLAFAKFMCGGTAGCVTWFVCFPFDTVKSKMQIHQGPDFLRWHRVLIDTIRNQGLFRLYRGVHV